MQPVRVQVDQSGAPLRRRQAGEGGVESALDPVGRHGGGRVDARPALIVEPDLGPGMRVALAHDPVVAERIQFAALIAGNHTRRHPGRAHQNDEGAGIVFAETPPAEEQEIIDAVFAQERWLERVEERLLAKVEQGALDDGAVIPGFGGPLPGQCEAARIALRQGQRAGAGRFTEPLGVKPIVEMGVDPIAQTLRDWRSCQPLQVGAKHGLQRRQALRQAKQEQPALAMRFQRDGVTQRFAAALAAYRVGRHGKAGLPGAAVEIPQHRAAPVQRVGGGGRLAGAVDELHPEGDLVGQRKLAEIARTHAVGQAGLCRALLRQTPERTLQTRKQHEQQQRQRQRLRQQAACRGERGARVGRGLEVGDHRRDQRDGGDDHVAGHGQALRVQEVRHQQEAADEQQAEAVARGSGFQQLGAGQKHQQRDAALRADDAAVLQQHTGDAGQGEQHGQPARPDPFAPAGVQAGQRECGPAQADPGRQGQRMRRQYQRQRHDQPEQGGIELNSGHGRIGRGFPGIGADALRRCRCRCFGRAASAQKAGRRRGRLAPSGSGVKDALRCPSRA